MVIVGACSMIISQRGRSDLGLSERDASAVGVCGNARLVASLGVRVLWYAIKRRRNVKVVLCCR